MDNPLNKLSSYPLHVNDNRGRSHKITHSTICKPEDDTATFEVSWPFRHLNLTHYQLHTRILFDISSFVARILSGRQSDRKSW
jgi:hypothetical protein